MSVPYMKRELYPLTYDPEWTDPWVVVSNNQVIFNPNYEVRPSSYIAFDTVRNWPELRFELSFVTDAPEEPPPGIRSLGELWVSLAWKTNDEWDYWDQFIPVPPAPGTEYTEYIYYPNISNARLELYLSLIDPGVVPIRCTAYVKNISSYVLGTASEVAKGSVTKTYNSTNYVETHRFKAAYAGAARSPKVVEFNNKLWRLVQYNNTVNYPAGVEMPYVEKGYTAYYARLAPLHWIYSEAYLETKVTAFRGGACYNLFEGRGNITTPSVLWEIQRSDGDSYIVLSDDIDKDGKLEIIAAFIGWLDHNSDGIICYDNEGNQKWRAYTRYTEDSTQWTENPITMTLFDVNGDGYKEILVCTYEGCYLHCFDHEGNELWRNQNIPGGAYIMEYMVRLNCKDVNDDGIIEMFEAPWDSRIYCRRADTGEQIWVTQVERNSGNFEMPGYSAISDIDNDGVDEVVVAHCNNRYLYCLNAENGDIKWKTPDGLYGSRIILYDFNNDGLLEIFVVTSRYGGGYPKIYKPDGTLLASSTDVVYNHTMAIFTDEYNNPYIGACYSNEPVVISYDRKSNSLNVKYGKAFSGIQRVVSADINNDGAYELLYLYDHGILCVDKNLNQLWNYNMPPTITADNAIAVDDVNGDGYLEIIFSSYDDNYSYLTVLKGG